MTQTARFDEERVHDCDDHRSSMPRPLAVTEDVVIFDAVERFAL
jgi:hypothetical protein